MGNKWECGKSQDKKNVRSVEPSSQERGIENMGVGMIEGREQTQEKSEEIKRSG